MQLAPSRDNLAETVNALPAIQHYRYITCFLGTLCAVFGCLDRTLSFSFSVSSLFELWIYTSIFLCSNSHLNPHHCPRNMNWKIKNTKEPLFSLGEGDISRMLNKLAVLLFFTLLFLWLKKLIGLTFDVKQSCDLVFQSFLVLEPFRCFLLSRAITALCQHLWWWGGLTVWKHFVLREKQTGQAPLAISF